MKAAWEERLGQCPKGYGCGEFLTVLAAYFGWVYWFPAIAPDPLFAAHFFAGDEARIAISFIGGVVAQLSFLLVMLFVFRGNATWQALKSLRQRAPSRGWRIALSIAALDIVVLYAVYIDVGPRIFELSRFSIAMSVVPAIDGFTQEIVFRGYLLLRMAEAGFGRFAQIIVSGLAFSLLHWGYGQGVDGGGIWDLLQPVLGTFGLGAAFAFAVQESRYRLLPVVIAHVLIILAVQPWLALSYMAQ